MHFPSMIQKIQYYLLSNIDSCCIIKNFCVYSWQCLILMSFALEDVGEFKFQYIEVSQDNTVYENFPFYSNNLQIK